MLDLSNQSFFKQDWSGQDLRNVLMNNSTFACCNFNKANLAGNNCSNSKFRGSTLDGTNCRNTNFANANLDCLFKPSDAFGMTLTLQCSTFRGMIVSSFWWYCWIQFALLMIPDKDEDGKTPTDILKQAIGIDKYLRLKRAFMERAL